MPVSPLLRLVLAAAFVGAAGSAPGAWAQVALDPAVEAPSLADHLDVLPDTRGDLPFSAVRDAEGFRPAPARYPADTSSPRTSWARLQLRSTSDQNAAWVLLLCLDEVTVYVVGPGGTIDQGRTGHHVPPAERPEPLAEPAVVIDLPAGAERTVYLHIRHDAGGYTEDLPLQLVEAERFYAQESRDNLVAGLFIGLLFGLAIYNLFLFVTFRDRSYLFYVLFLIGTMVYWMVPEGYLTLFAWPSSVREFLELNFFALTLAASAYLQFARSYLHTESRAPRMDRLLGTLIVLWGVAATLGVASVLGARLWGVAQLVAASVALAMLVSTLTAGVQAHRRGYRPARYYLLASAPMILAGFLYTLGWLGVPGLRVATSYGLQIGTAAEVLLFAIALSFRIRLLDRERHMALTQKERAEATNTALQETNAALEEADALKTHLLGMAAHDLRTPLTSILGYADLLRIHAEGGTVEDRSAREICRSADQMVGLIDDLLVTAALESGKLSLHRTPVDLGVVARETVDLLAPRAARKEQRLALTIDHPGVVEADRSRLRDVVDNLVSNAIKFTPRGGEITVRVTPENGEVRLAVTDTGPGLSEEDQRQLFRPFQRLTPKPTGGESSNGLGLSIVAQFVELHGGRVGVQSHLGAGSTFSVALPRTAPPETDPARLEAVGVA